MAAVKRTCVYVISAGPRRHKIGITHDLLNRLRTFQTAHDVPLSIVDFAAVDDIVEVERAVHAALAPWRLKGEWFAVTAEQALDALRDATRPPPEHDFQRGELVRCIWQIEDGVAPFPEVGKVYTVQKVHVGGHLDLLWVPNPRVSWPADAFLRAAEIWDPGIVI